ncbi:single-stranded DNA-binding protein [Candidatus Aerophobetes bacterium]|uniref:Single-stranded DNA-binding protein n=1 Tax=Aerophobetes bacterium TaxID=2030807 RepID=A0A662DF15_UNCAE|nr:MAG: single-stranded DNA-binding protein [Candidatus Aerophobetes bacterium]
MNRVILIGNLTQDPELRYTPDGTPVVSFTLAVNRSFTNQEGERETDFIPVVVWRKQAERCSEYLTKGSQVAVDGRLQIRSYEDKDGIRRKVSEVVAWRVEFLQRLKKPSLEEAPFEKVENEIDKISISGEDMDVSEGESDELDAASEPDVETN